MNYPAYVNCHNDYWQRKAEWTRRYQCWMSRLHARRNGAVFMGHEFSQFLEERQMEKLRARFAREHGGTI